VVINRMGCWCTCLLYRMSIDWCFRQFVYVEGYLPKYSLNVLGSCRFSFTNFIRYFTRLHAGALRQLIIGRMGLCGLCGFINALRVGG
jgi:hypothetical protein